MVCQLPTSTSWPDFWTIKGITQPICGQIHRPRSLVPALPFACAVAAHQPQEKITFMKVAVLGILWDQFCKMYKMYKHNPTVSMIIFLSMITIYIHWQFSAYIHMYIYIHSNSIYYTTYARTFQVPGPLGWPWRGGYQRIQSLHVTTVYHYMFIYFECRQVMAQTFVQEAAHTQCFLLGRVTVIVTLGSSCFAVWWLSTTEPTTWGHPPQHLAMSPSHLPRYINPIKSQTLKEPTHSSLPPPNGKLSKPAVHVQQAKIRPEIPTGESFFTSFSCQLFMNWIYVLDWCWCIHVPLTVEH